MAEPKSTSSNNCQGGGFFEFSSEKKWGTEQDDCKIFDSIDMTRLADSIASVPFHVRHNLPNELFTVEQLEEFEVEASLALSRHTFQNNSKLKCETAPTSVESSQNPETDKLMKILLDSFSSAEDKMKNASEHTIQSNSQLDTILGNMKPLINMLEDETNLSTAKATVQSDCVNNENQVSPMNTNSDKKPATQDSGHWLDSMFDSDE